MATTPQKPITTSPKTDSQLRSVLNRLSKTNVTLVAELGELRDVFLRTGVASAAVAAGDILYAPASGSVAPAQASTAAKSVVIGIALNAASIGVDVVYLTLGVKVDLSGLTAGTVYYLSAVTPGAMVSIPDAVTGQFIVKVGHATTTTEFLFMPSISVLL